MSRRPTSSHSAALSELQQLIDTDPGAKANWLRLTSAQQRMLREEVASAKQSETRMRRARRVLT